MTEPLTLKYRPRKFLELIGQDLNAIVLQKMVDSSSVPSGLLFSGPSGTGKTSAARILSNCLDAQSETTEIDAASNGGVSDIRTLIDGLRYGHPGKYRVVILDEAHSVSREGFNALLKTLEEPPTGTVFVLASTEPEKIPETVKSRLIEFEFRRVSPAEILSRLELISSKESIVISSELLTFIADESNGSVRRSIMILDQCNTASIKTIEKYQELSGNKDVASELLVALASGDAALIFQTLDKQLRLVGNPHTISSQLTECLRDLMVLRAGGKIRLTGEGGTTRKEQAYTLEPERVIEAIQILWQLKTLRVSDDPRGNLELALVLISEVFTRGKRVSTPVVPVIDPVSVTPSPKLPEQPLTLQELKARMQ